VEEFLKRRFPKQIKLLEIVEKEDLDLSNHLSGKKQRAIKVVFPNNEYFRLVKQYLQPIVTKNQKKESTETAFDSIFETDSFQSSKIKKVEEASDCISDLREHDLLYYTRVTIDQGLFFLNRFASGVVVQCKTTQRHYHLAATSRHTSQSRPNRTCFRY
jgi:DNA polymerase epsilon subunit 1